jgi:hypothetical protein
MSEPARTVKAVRDCAEWLSYCLQIGWKREQLDELEALWWKYHNWHGELVSRSDVPEEAAG